MEHEKMIQLIAVMVIAVSLAVMAVATAWSTWNKTGITSILESAGYIECLGWWAQTDDADVRDARLVVCKSLYADAAESAQESWEEWREDSDE